MANVALRNIVFLLRETKTQIHQILDIKVPGFISRRFSFHKWLNFHYRPHFVFHYWPQNVCFLCVLPDLRTATLDNIFSWIIPKHQYKASECLLLPLKTPCLQTLQDWLFAYGWTKYEIVVFPTLSQSECMCCLLQLKYCLSRMWQQIRASFGKHFQSPKSQNSQ